MKCLNLTFSTPEENLACDEALIESCETGIEGGFNEGILRLWSPTTYFVVMGYGNHFEREVNVNWCREHSIPVLRRISGGGAVLQGPGCLNFSLILSAQITIGKLNAFVLNKHRSALETIFGSNVTVEGISDIAYCGKKVSGNAQRWKKNFVLFHGTFLLNFDLSLIEKVLHHPSKEPKYRAGRSHLDFVINLNAEREAIECLLRDAWGAKDDFAAVPHEKINELVNNRYLRPEWTYKF